jgi:DNA-binding IscR family transcriptional regulator
VNLLWVRVRDAIAGALDAMTLADLVPQRIVVVETKTDPSTLSGALTTT